MNVYAKRVFVFEALKKYKPKAKSMKMLNEAEAAATTGERLTSNCDVKRMTGSCCRESFALHSEEVFVWVSLG